MSAAHDVKQVDRTAVEEVDYDKKDAVAYQNVEERTGHPGNNVESDLVILSHDVDAIYDRAIALSSEEVIEILEEAYTEHHDDPNFPATVLAKIEYFLSGDSSTLEDYDNLLEEMKIEAGLIRFSSPYPEVRAVVACFDDPNMPVSTFRVWFIGTIWCGLGSFINQFFHIRTPALSLSVNEVQLLSYPFGKALEKILPTKSISAFGQQWSLNPGPFNEKEHMLITIMANVGMFAPYTVYILITSRLEIFYDQAWAADFGYQITTSLSMQLIGMGFAGMTRRFLVYPEHCIWLFNLATIALNKSFHDTTNVVANGWRISRMRFFIYVFSASFIYYFLPGGVFQALSYFNWITWIAPQNKVLATIFGQITGLGLNPLIPTLDWSQFGSNYMIFPWFSTLNQFAGTLLSAPIILAFYYGNVWDTGYFPMMSNRIFSNTGGRYNVSRILTAEKVLDVTAYDNYSKPYMAASNLVLYGAFFAVYSATVVHTVLYHRKEISDGFKNAYRSIRSGQRGNAAFKDFHNQAMLAYPEVPELWYLAVTLFAIGMGVVGLTVWPTNANVSSIFFGIFLCIVLVIPIGIILSITGIQITLNVFAEFIGGLIYPGNALSMNYFKSFGVMTTINALQFAQDLKLAHYMKIGQRWTFAVQIYGAVLATFVSISILNFQMTSIPDVCTVDQPQHFICNSEATFFTASVFWGTLGPQRVFGIGGIYTGLLLGFAIGAVLPIPFYLLTVRYPKSWISKVHIPVILNGALIWGPYSNMSQVWPGVIVAFFFQYYIKNRYLAWWSKYNYVLATAMGASIPLCGIIIFAAMSNTGLTPDWVGNNIPFEGCDGTGCRRLKVPAVGYIGQAPGEGNWQ